MAIKLVASALLHHGRLAYHQMLRLVPVAPRTILQCLIVLIQHDCVWHSDKTKFDPISPISISPESIPALNEISFEVDPQAILMRLRFGEIIVMAMDFFKDSGASMVKLLLRHGTLQVGQMFDMIEDEAGLFPDDAHSSIRPNRLDGLRASCCRPNVDRYDRRKFCHLRQSFFTLFKGRQGDDHGGRRNLKSAR